MNYPGVMQGPAVKGFSRLTQASASRPTIQQVTGQQADDEVDNAADEVPDEYPFQYLTDRDHQSIVRCATLQDRIGLIEDNNKLWRKDTEGEQEFLRESVRFQRMGKSSASSNCTCSLALLRVTWAQSASALGKGKFFRNMRDARSDERKLLSDWVKTLKATIEEQARLKGPLSSASSCPTPQQSAKEPAKVVQRELLDVGSSERQPSRALAVRKGFDLTAGFARSASSSYTVESRERLHSLVKDPNPPSAFGRRRVSTHSDKRDTTLDPRLPGNALQLTDPGELVATVQSQSLDNTALRPPRETKATGGYPAAPNDSAPILRPSNETQTLGRLSKVVPDPKLPIEAVDPDDFKGPENRGFRDWSRAYQVRKSEFFRPGRVFAVLWPEPAGSSGNKGAASRFDPTEKNPNLIHGPRGEKIYVHPQRMVVIRTGHGYCWCVMINTYGGQGLLKGGFRQEDIDAHAIIYDRRQKPLALSSKGKAEPRSKKRAIAVDMEGQETLSPASRVHLGKPSTVEYNFKVMQVGQVVEADLQYLIASVKSELRI